MSSEKTTKSISYNALLQSRLSGSFHDDEIRKGCYRPNLHVAIENVQYKVLGNLKNALDKGKLHVIIHNQDTAFDQSNN